MLLDYPSLLVAIGFSAVCLSVILLASWWAARADTFLLTCAIGNGLIVVHVFAYRLYIDAPDPWHAALAFVLLIMGLAVLRATAHQFRSGASPLTTIRPDMVGVLIVLAPFAAGYDGIGCILVNLIAATQLGFTAREYWRCRSEAPGAITALSTLYSLTAASFVLCAVMLVCRGEMVLGAPPSGWAEDLNVIIGIIAVPGIGAVTLALNQTRLARAHKREAMTDALTGLLNRRAMFDAIAAQPLHGDVALVLFDIDRFKAINDEHGHSTGDQVLVQFARAMRLHSGPQQIAARLGGEEFALILRGASADTALRYAEAVCAGFTALVSTQLGLTCTTSAGIAFGQPNAYDFEATLNAADQMLYQAKRSGRDRVAIAPVRLAEYPLRPRSSSRP